MAAWAMMAPYALFKHTFNQSKLNCYGGHVTIVCIGLSKGERLFAAIVQDFILHPFVLHCRTGPEELNQEPQTSPIILL